jgi:uncharacterized repeat protein (TIGR01451 family)
MEPDARVVAPGGAVAYRVTLVNQGGCPASDVMVREVLPACLDASALAADPQAHVSVDPGPLVSVEYDEPRRELLVTLEYVRPDFVDPPQVIHITGLQAVTAGECCGQAEIFCYQTCGFYNVTDDPLVEPGLEDPTCLLVASSMELLRNDEPSALAPLTPPLSSIFTGPPPGCSVADPWVSLDPTGPAPDCSPVSGEGSATAGHGSDDQDDLYMADVSLPLTDPDSGVLSDASRLLVFWQLQNANPNGLRLTKDALGQSVLLEAR